MDGLGASQRDLHPYFTVHHADAVQERDANLQMAALVRVCDNLPAVPLAVVWVSNHDTYAKPVAAIGRGWKTGSRRGGHCQQLFSDNRGRIPLGKNRPQERRINICCASYTVRLLASCRVPGLNGQGRFPPNKVASRFAEKRLVTRSFAALSVMQSDSDLTVGSAGIIDQLVLAVLQGYRLPRL